MDIEELLAAVDQLSPADLARLKAHIIEREQERLKAVEAWGAALEAAAAEFRGDSTPKQSAGIFVAMNLKSPPSEKGL